VQHEYSAVAFALDALCAASNPPIDSPPNPRARSYDSRNGSAYVGGRLGLLSPFANLRTDPARGSSRSGEAARRRTAAPSLKCGELAFHFGRVAGGAFQVGINVLYAPQHFEAVPALGALVFVKRHQ
jgi:hypothetical protein